MKYVPQQRLALRNDSTCTCDIPDSLPCEGAASTLANDYVWGGGEEGAMVRFVPIFLKNAFKEELFKP